MALRRPAGPAAPFRIGGCAACNCSCCPLPDPPPPFRPCASARAPAIGPPAGLATADVRPPESISPRGRRGDWPRWPASGCHSPPPPLPPPTPPPPPPLLGSVLVFRRAGRSRAGRSWVISRLSCERSHREENLQVRGGARRRRASATAGIAERELGRGTVFAAGEKVGGARPVAPHGEARADSEEHRHAAERNPQRARHPNPTVQRRRDRSSACGGKPPQRHHKHQARSAAAAAAAGARRAGGGCLLGARAEGRRKRTRTRLRGGRRERQCARGLRMQLSSPSPAPHRAGGGGQRGGGGRGQYQPAAGTPMWQRGHSSRGPHLTNEAGWRV